jgi:PIN domain nuclease of toxin-antitoxin system
MKSLVDVFSKYYQELAEERRANRLTSAFASATLDVLVNAAASFSIAIQHQLEMLQNDPSPAKFAKKTIEYAESKTAYFKALREELPELLKIAAGK